MHRQTGLDVPAFPPDRPAPTEARYHRRGEPWPLYASFEPETAWAEWRAASGGAVRPAGERRRLWRLDVDGLRVLDLRRPAVRRELGVELDDLVGPRATAQQLGVRARALGAEGLVVPSAARDGHWNLVAFPMAFAKLRVRGSSAGPPAVEA